MLNGIWCVMVIIGIVYGMISGNIGDITNAVLESSKEAVTLCITMLGVMAMWNGLMEIASQSGLVERLSVALYPVISFLFPKIPPKCKAREEISLNFIANVLGLGWAATPAGLRAMEELAKLKGQRDGPVYKEHLQCGKQNVATDEMCTFLILNISSLQLIPVNIIAYRSQYGSVNSAAVIVPGILATLCSTLAAIVFCKIKTRKKDIIIR